jgi:serine protease Do
MTVKRGEETLRKELTLVGELRPYESAFLGILPERPDPAKPEAAGVAIRFVYPDSPASRAGLKPGDRVLKFQGSEAPNAAALTDLISRVRPGEKVMLTVQSGEMQREIEASLESMPDVVPADLRRVFIPPAEKPAEAEKAPKTGRFTETLAAYEHDYWAYVPDDYNPAFKYALMVWVHPPGDTMEAALFKAWKNHCDERGIILLAPKAKQIGGWAANEQEFVKDLVDQFLTKYSIDRSRVLVHSFAKGSPFASTLVFKYRELFRGLAMAAAPFSVQPPDNEPDFRLQMFVIYGQKDPQFANVQASAKVIQKMKYPLILRLLKSGDQKYPGEGPLEELVRWIDSLDRI